MSLSNLYNIFTTRVRQSDLIKGFISSSFWGISSKLTAVAITLYCTNSLTQEGFGEFSFIRNTLDMIVVICATTFSTLAVKLAAESITDDDSLRKLYLLFEFTISVSIVISVFFLIIPETKLEEFTGGNQVAYFMRIAGICMPLFIVQPLISAVLRGYRKFNLVGIYETTNSLIFLVLVVIGIHLFDYQGAIWGLIAYLLIFTFTGCSILYVINKKYKYIKKVVNIHSQKHSLYNMMLPVFLMSFVEAPLLWLAQAEIGRKETYAVVGCLSVFLTIRYMIQILPTYFYQSFVPHATILNSNRQFEDYFGKYKQISLMLLVIIVICMPVLLLLGKPLLCLFDTTYVAFYSSFALSILVMPLLLYSTLFKINLMIREHQIGMFYMTIVSSLLFLGSFYMFSYWDFNLLHAFFYSQSIQFGYQLLYSLKIYNSDKNKCKNI